MELLTFYLHSQSLIGVRTGNPARLAALWDDVCAGFYMLESAVVTWT